jgi:methylthioribose-1-phosphate isomerase
LTWVDDSTGFLRILDQTKLPGELVEAELRTVEQVFEAIQSLRVRGAPAIGIAAAYGVVIGMQSQRLASRADFFDALEEVAAYLASSRPTAVNLSWALERMKQAARSRPSAESSEEILACLWETAREIHEEDRQMCHAIGNHGADWFIARGLRSLLTHCNAGGLATAEYGTALAVMFTMQDRGQDLRVYVDETRPLLQGSRLTAWELVQRGIPATLICDSMAAHVMRMGWVDAVITGADRIALNGDSANKIGTYALAVLARAHGIPFFVAAPTSTFDLAIESGESIPIELRRSEEITHWANRPVAPPGVRVYNPAFDVTPAEYIDAIITDRGVIHPVDAKAIVRVLGHA